MLILFGYMESLYLSSLIETLALPHIFLDVGRILDVHILGQGFYQIEFVDVQSVTKVLAMNPLAIQGACVFFMPWFHDFEPIVEVTKERLLPITMCFGPS